MGHTEDLDCEDGGKHVLRGGYQVTLKAALYGLLFIVALPIEFTPFGFKR